MVYDSECFVNKRIPLHLSLRDRRNGAAESNDERGDGYRGTEQWGRSEEESEEEEGWENEEGENMGEEGLRDPASISRFAASADTCCSCYRYMLQLCPMAFALHTLLRLCPLAFNPHAQPAQQNNLPCFLKSEIG